MPWVSISLDVIKFMRLGVSGRVLGWVLLKRRVWKGLKERGGSHGSLLHRPLTVWPDLAKFCRFGKKKLKDFGNLWRAYTKNTDIWKNFEQTFPNFLWYWARFYCFKWPNIEKVIWSSCHTVPLRHKSSFSSTLLHFIYFKSGKIVFNKINFSRERGIFEDL